MARNNGKNKINAESVTMNTDELNYLEEKVHNMKQMTSEKMEKDWGVDTKLNDYNASSGYKNIDRSEASA